MGLGNLYAGNCMEWPLQRQYSAKVPVNIRLRLFARLPASVHLYRALKHLYFLNSMVVSTFIGLFLLVAVYSFGMIKA